ncbi:MAG: class I SAM-dependent methyltransferase [Gemmatimonadota bacterium]|nr:class I SAM-dependent methyltransferase [Gemmatimonadota bacterium]
MGIYRDHIFPRLMDGGLSGPQHRTLRARALTRAHGEVLEIGFGTGLNLSCYPPDVERLVGVDPAVVLEHRVAGRVSRARFPVERSAQDASERLPFEDATFDTVVSTWTLCSIDRLRRALTELRRVLRPEGVFLFLEHGRSDRTLAATLQDAVNPLQNVVACGCNLNRKIDQEIQDAGFRIIELERFKVPGVPRVFGEVYEGVATHADRETGPAGRG